MRRVLIIALCASISGLALYQGTSAFARDLLIGKPRDEVKPPQIEEDNENAKSIGEKRELFNRGSDNKLQTGEFMGGPSLAKASRGTTTWEMPKSWALLDPKSLAAKKEQTDAVVKDMRLTEARVDKENQKAYALAMNQIEKQNAQERAMLSSSSPSNAFVQDNKTGSKKGLIRKEATLEKKTRNSTELPKPKRLFNSIDE